jgi:hypothetical protein
MTAERERKLVAVVRALWLVLPALAFRDLCAVEDALIGGEADEAISARYRTEVLRAYLDGLSTGAP